MRQEEVPEVEVGEAPVRGAQALLVASGSSIK